jgi:putative DNA primase/helicase
VVRGVNVSNGTGGVINPPGVSEFHDILRNAPEETVGKWVSIIQERYNLHPHPEATLDELRAWLEHIRYDILPSIHGGTSDPAAVSSEIDPFFGGTASQWRAAELAIDDKEKRREREEKAIHACAKLNLTDFGNADRFLKRYGDQVKYCPPWSEWFVFDQTVGAWTRDERGHVKEMAKETLVSIYNEAGIRVEPDARSLTAKWAIKCERSHHVQEILGLASSRKEIVILPQDLDADDYKLCLKNGVYDLRTHTLDENHPREHLHSRYVPIEYQPGRLCPMWTRFLDRIFRSREDKDELIEFLQRAAGYTLTGSIQEQCLFLLYGSGANGKSVFLEVLRAVLGGSKGYAKVCDASTFTTARTDAVRNDIAALAGVRLVTTNENPPGSSIDEALIKEITGEREITARFLFKDYFTYRPRFKIWWAFNHQPRIGDGTWSIWRRIRLIPFQEQIPPDEQNPHLAEDLVSTEASGILNWCLEGLKKYQVDGLPVPAAIQRATNEYRDDQDVLHDFLTILCRTTPDPGQLKGIADQDISESAKNLYQAYCQWCNQMNEKRMGQRKFGMKLSEKGYVKEHTMKGNRWRGIMLKQNWTDVLND